MHVPPRVAGGLQAQGSFFGRNISGPAQHFIHEEGSSGRLLLVAAIIALVWANSPWSEYYERLWHHEIILNIGFINVAEDLRHWVNDGLMAVFFFLITLEVKREVTRGELSSRRKAALPIAAAFGGMVLPASIYLAFNATGANPEGWGIPIATDTAFALGALALIARGAPSALVTLLLGTAVVDDVMAMLIIAIFYTESLDLLAATVAGGMFLAVLVAQWMGIRAIAAYLIIAFVLWLAVLQSGVHATIAGVLLGALTPARPVLDMRLLPGRARPLLDTIENAGGDDRDPEADHALGELESLVYDTESPLERMEHKIHPWSGFVVLPLFALANAGIVLSTEAISDAVGSTVALGVFLGLWIGKPIGIVLGAWLAVRLQLAALPDNVSWGRIAGIGALSGIGFSVSIFITDLAFEGDVAEQAKLGILTATVLSALTAAVIFRLARRSDDVVEAVDLVEA